MHMYYMYVGIRPVTGTFPFYRFGTRNPLFKIWCNISETERQFLMIFHVYSFRYFVLFHKILNNINPNPLRILARNLPESSSKLLETCPYLQNAPCIPIDLSYSALMACTSCQVVILPRSKRWTYSFQQCWIFPKKCPVEDFDGIGGG